MTRRRRGTRFEAKGGARVFPRREAGFSTPAFQRGQGNKPPACAGTYPEKVAATQLVLQLAEAQEDGVLDARAQGEVVGKEALEQLQHVVALLRALKVVAGLFIGALLEERGRGGVQVTKE